MRTFYLGADGEEFYYLSGGVVTENGKPCVGISRWDAGRRLLDMRNKYHGFFSPRLPTLYQSHRAAEEDPEIRESVFSFPAEWQRNLALNPGAPGETEEYVLIDNDSGQVLEPSSRPRLINPVMEFGSPQTIVRVHMFDIPFEMERENSRYNPEDLDPETGFIGKTGP